MSLPLPQLERRFPPCRGVHRDDEHQDVGIVINPLVAECMRLLCAHQAEATAPPVVDCCESQDAPTTGVGAVGASTAGTDIGRKRRGGASTTAVCVSRTSPWMSFRV